MKQPQLSDVENLARQAGKILRDNFGKKIDIGHKGVIDLVTEVDHKVEAFVVSEIQSKFPSHQIIAEESGEQHGNEQNRW